MRTVVTGATGHLGNNLVRALLERGQQVRALVLPQDDPRPLAGLAVEQVEGDVRDLGSLMWALRDADTVYHLAGIITIAPGRSALLQQVNVQGTRNVIEAVLRSGVRRLVHTASIHAIVEPPHGTTIDESWPFDPARIPTEYGRSKAEAALEVLAAVARGLDAVICCPTGIVGPHDYVPSEFGQLILNVARRRLPAYVQGSYDFVDVRDVARGLIAAGERGRRGESYILSGEQVTVAQLMAWIEEASGVPAPRVGLPAGVARWAAGLAARYARLRGTKPLFTAESVDILCSNCCISHEKATRELGHRPRPLRETIADTVRWFREAGALAAPQRWGRRWAWSPRKVSG